MTKNVELVYENGEAVHSCYYIVDAIGRKVYAKTKDRKKAREAFDIEFGKDKYAIRIIGLPTGKKQVTCKA